MHTDFNHSNSYNKKCMTHKCKLCLPPHLYSVTSNHPTQQNTAAHIAMAGVILLSWVIYISCLNSEKWLKSVYIYGSYRKINTVLLLFGPLCG